MLEAYAHCEQLVREADKDRFLATLFAPADRRPHLYALYAFNIEISRVREASHNALPGTCLSICIHRSNTTGSIL